MSSGLPQGEDAAPYSPEKGGEERREREGEREETGRGAGVEGSYCLPGSVVAVPEPGQGGGQGAAAFKSIY